MSKLQPAPMSAHVIAPDRTRTPKAHVWERGRGEGHVLGLSRIAGCPCSCMWVGAGQVAPFAFRRIFIFRPEGTPQPGSGAERKRSGADRARDRTK